jgi:hypothetical protein
MPRYERGFRVSYHHALARHASQLGQVGLGPVGELEHGDRERGVETGVGEGQAQALGAGDGDAMAGAGQHRRGGVDADHAVAALRQRGGEVAGAAAGVEHGGGRAHGTEQLEDQGGLELVG